jgi:hypothetical protein
MAKMKSLNTVPDAMQKMEFLFLNFVDHDTRIKLSFGNSIVCAGLWWLMSVLAYSGDKSWFHGLVSTWAKR